MIRVLNVLKSIISNIYQSPPIVFFHFLCATEAKTLQVWLPSFGEWHGQQLHLQGVGEHGRCLSGISDLGMKSLDERLPGIGDHLHMTCYILYSIMQIHSITSLYKLYTSKDACRYVWVYWYGDMCQGTCRFLFSRLPPNPVLWECKGTQWRGEIV